MNTTMYLGIERMTDDVWVDPANGDRYPVYEKIISTGALPNATSKNVAHGITDIAANKYLWATLWASNGTVSRSNSSDPAVIVDASNIVIQAAGNLSTYTASTVYLKYCKTSHKV